MTSAAQPTIEEVTPANFADLVRLMEGRGGPKHCWCLVWRDPHKLRQAYDLEGRREAMRTRVQREPLGLLAYLGGEPMGWCSVSPRETLVDLGGLDYGEGIEVWSIVCFFVPTRLRGQGIASALLSEAVAVARRHGADVVEATPVEPDSPSYRFMGFIPSYLALGFEEIQMAGTRRHVMHRLLTPKARRRMAARSRQQPATS